MYASHICRPKPEDAPIHSATTAPINDSGAATLRAANRNGHEDGHRALHEHLAGADASIERSHSAIAGSTERKPSRALMRTGKKVSSAVTITFGPCPKPIQMVRIGATAITGVDLIEEGE